MFLSSRLMWVFKIRQLAYLWMKKLYWYFDLRRILIASSIVLITVLAILPFVTEKKIRYLPCNAPPSAHNPNRFNQDNSGFPPFNYAIVPNVIHFYRTGVDVNNINYLDALCLYSAFRIGNPDKIVIHTDDVPAVTKSFSKSPYGIRLMQISGFKRTIDVQYWPLPRHVFGIDFNSIHRLKHISDVTRLRILRKYGGIFLDKHAFILKNLQQLRYYEMSIFKNKRGLSNDLIMAHRDARMLDLWLKSYHRYNPDIEVHHNTEYVKSLFLKKTTFYHESIGSVREGGLSLLNEENGLVLKGCDECYLVHVNISSSGSFENSLENLVNYEGNHFVELVDWFVST